MTELTPPRDTTCHPYDEECGPWGKCRNHGGVVPRDTTEPRTLRERVEALADEWSRRADVAEERARHMAGDRRDVLQKFAAEERDRASELRAVLATPPRDTTDTEALAEALVPFDLAKLLGRADVARWLATRDAALRAEALREAADAFQKAWPVYGDDWLRGRADSIARGAL